MEEKMLFHTFRRSNSHSCWAFSRHLIASHHSSRILPWHSPSVWAEGSDVKSNSMHFSMLDLYSWGWWEDSSKHSLSPLQHEILNELFSKESQLSEQVDVDNKLATSSNNFTTREPEKILSRSAKCESTKNCRRGSSILNRGMSHCSSRKLRRGSNCLACDNEKSKHSPLRFPLSKLMSCVNKPATWPSYLMHRLMIAPQSNGGSLEACERHRRTLETVFTCETASV